MTVVHLINATLDGRGDHRAVIPDDDLHAHALQTIADADLILYGSGTYRLLAPHWSRVARERSGSATVDEFARVLAEKPKVLFSARAEAFPGWNTEVDARDPCDRVPELLAGGADKLVVQASPQLARSLRIAGHVDSMRVLLQPQISGSGPALFGPGETHDLTLRAAETMRSGAIALDYGFAARPA